MPMSQANVTGSTPMGATLVAGGASFKVWAPSASAVYLNGTFAGAADWSKDTNAGNLLVRDGAGYWSGFRPNVSDGDLYKFWVVGPAGATTGYKRDPYARELTSTAPFPNVNCIVRDPSTYPWHDGAFATPDFTNMIVYQAHVGTYPPTAPAFGTFLDLIEKIPYLVALGINVLQPLPVTECEENPSSGYNGADYFSPDTLFTQSDPAKLAQRVATINGLLGAKGLPPLAAAQIASGANQLKALVDLCHLHGIAVVFDVVYNHAGGFFGDDESLYFWDRQPTGNNNDSLYFTDRGMAGGLAFALWKREVRQFLIDNARFWIGEFHADGFRYDEISMLLANDVNNGWSLCQDLTGTIRFVKNRAIQNAEYWPSEFSAPVSSIVSRGGGAGFDVVQHDAFRTAMRGAIATASGGTSAPVDMDALAFSLKPALPNAWSAVQCVENHDVVLEGRDPRVPALADENDSQSFYARSRAKVATGLLLTVPGIPQLFMGQEFLEDKQWNTDPSSKNRIYWAGLDAGNKAMVDQLRFVQDFVHLRWNQPALRGPNVNPFHRHNQNRVLAVHRWLDGEGRDVVVVASLADSAYFGYQLGFPRQGHWSELFNSDIYDNWVNPLAVGNYGGMDAFGGPRDDLPTSAAITIPPRAVLVFGFG
jgi:1,4-alpha-glucan branching enzyme